MSSMSCNLTRFYYDLDGWPVVEDIETIEADEFEQNLNDQDIPYTRMDM